MAKKATSNDPKNIARRMELASFEQKMHLLNKIAWTARDIAKYMGVSEVKATEIKKKIAEKYGEAPYVKCAVKAKDVLAEYGTTKIEEMALMKEGILLDNAIRELL